MKTTKKTKTQDNVSIVVNRGKIHRRNIFLKRKIAKLKIETDSLELLNPYFEKLKMKTKLEDELSSNMFLLQLLDKYEDKNKKVTNSQNKIRKPKGAKNGKK